MAQTIDVVFRYYCGADQVDRQFDDFAEAAHYAVAVANSAGRSDAIVPPNEIRIVEDGAVLFAIKVFFGGLNPADAPGSPAMSMKPARTQPPTAARRC